MVGMSLKEGELVAGETNLGLYYLHRYGLRGCLVCDTQRFSVGKELYRNEAPEGMMMVMIVCDNCGFSMTVNAEKVPRRRG